MYRTTCSRREPPRKHSEDQIVLAGLPQAQLGERSTSGNEVDDEMVLSDDRKIETRAGVLPYLALVAGAIIIFIAHKIAVY